MRITYWIASGRRIKLTVFTKTRMHEDREIERRGRAVARCIAEEHDVAEESEGKRGERSNWKTLRDRR